MPVHTYVVYHGFSRNALCFFNTHPNLDSSGASVSFSTIDNIEIKCHVDNIDNVDRIIMNLLCIT